MESVPRPVVSLRSGRSSASPSAAVGQPPLAPPCLRVGARPEPCAAAMPAAAAPMISSVQKLVLYETRAVSSVCPAAPGGGEETPGRAPRWGLPLRARGRAGGVPAAVSGAAAFAGLPLAKTLLLTLLSCIYLFFPVTHPKYMNNQRKAFKILVFTASLPRLI